ncbi:MAG: protein kinase [Planctomycetota bacterium]
MSKRQDASRSRSIADAALQLPEEERLPFVDDQCGSDAELRDQVLRSLELELASTRRLAPRDADGDSFPFAGRRLGEYRLLQEIGSGGMGSVWEAERVGSYQQQVAIKILRGWVREQDRVRFERERQILARLEHAGIARLYDGGETESGVPYLVMERVDGQRVDDYCTEQKLGHREIVALVVEVARAVEYAHDHGVVHRDLKPSNILVNNRGAPHLLDFGISKILGDDEPELTTPEQRVHTPRYASPEQIDGLDVSPATDVHALGVLLFELLTGKWPFGDDDVSRTRVESSVLRVPALAPSAVQRAEAKRNDDTATRTRDTVRRWWSSSRDLDTIVLQALRKEPERRYLNAREFRLDLERFLEGSPVSARAESTWYRTRKFVAQRAAVLICSVAILAAALAIGLAVSKSQPEVRFDLRLGPVERDRVELRWDGNGLPVGAWVRVIPDQGEPVDLSQGVSSVEIGPLALTPHVVTAELYRGDGSREVIATARCEFDLSPRIPVLLSDRWRLFHDATFSRWGEHRFVDPVFADTTTLLLAAHRGGSAAGSSGVFAWRVSDASPSRVVDLQYAVTGLGFDPETDTILTARRSVERVDRFSWPASSEHHPLPVAFRGDRVVARGIRCVPSWYEEDRVRRGEALVAGRRGTVWSLPVVGDEPSQMLFPVGGAATGHQFSDVEFGRREVFLSDPRPPDLGGGLYRLTPNGVEPLRTSEVLSPRGLAWDTIREELIVASSGNLSSGRIVAVDPRTGQVEPLIELPNPLPGFCWNGVAVSPDGRFLATVDLRGVSFFERTSFDVTSAGGGGAAPDSEEGTLRADPERPEAPTRH